MDGQTPKQEGAQKKGIQLDDLSREELIKKCRGLLGIAHKAKQAKDECMEENRKLREELNNYETQKSADKNCLKAMQEVVESLTEQKLKNTTEIDKLMKLIAKYEKKADECEKLSIENEVYQRQISRLTQENEELLVVLSSQEDNKNKETDKIGGLEKEIAEFKTKEDKYIRKMKLYKNKLQEIQGKLLLLKSDRQILLKTVKDYSKSIPKWQSELRNLSTLLFDRVNVYEKENNDLKNKSLKLEEELERTSSNNNDEMFKKIMSLEQELSERIEHSKKLDSDVDMLQIELGNSKKEVDLLSSRIEEFKENQLNRSDKIDSNQEAKHEALEENMRHKEQEITNLQDALETVEKESITLRTALESKEKNLQEIHVKLSTYESEITQFKIDVKKTSSDLEKQLQQSQSLEDQLVKKNKELVEINHKYDLLRVENSELLAELKEINENLKERGSVISLQSSKILELETKIKERIENTNTESEDLKKRLENLENKLGEREAECQSLKDELNKSSFINDSQSEVLSTSTISRADESMRMREIEDSFEEKYNKLRALAVKLKKKVTDQQLIIQKMDNKNVQSLQSEYDKLLDELEISKQKIKQFEAGKSSETKDEKPIDQEIYNLKKELDAFQLIKNEIDSENKKLQNLVKTKEKELNDEMEVQKALKSEMDKIKVEVKKAKLLQLEIEATEKSSLEMSKKLESKNREVSELEGTVEAQVNNIKSLQSQLGLLEQNLSSESAHAKDLKHDLEVQQGKLRESEHSKSELTIELDQMKRNLANMQLEMDANRDEMTQCVSEKEKICANLESENIKLLKQVYNLEEELSQLKALVKEKEQEIEDLKTEFASYKIRAQSVLLKQNQTKDSGREKELEDEINTVQKSLESKETKLISLKQKLEELTKNYQEVNDDKIRLQNRYKELHDLLEESRLQNENLLDDSRRANLQHQEALKTQRLQSETLINCYKKQIEDLEDKYSKEREKYEQILSEKNNKELQRTNDTRSLLADEQKINLILMEREEGEGSESTSSQNAYPSVRRKISTNKSRSRDLIPLDELLNSSFEDNQVFDDSTISVSPTVELQQTKEKLNMQESRVKHLTALLAEAEQDLAKLTQLNEVLKEEVRRQQRSIEREKHVHNSEYLKNVIFKFLTLNSGDEKTHLVPVLNTILKLSPDETQKLMTVAKGGDPNGRGWTGYLPIWSS